MTDPISPIGGGSGARRVSRRSAGADDSREAGEDGGARLPMVIDTEPKTAPPRSRRAALAAFAAQLMGQGGAKRGLRGGPETLDKARSAYLEAEWSGPSDRRPRPGRITKTDI